MTYSPRIPITQVLLWRTKQRQPNQVNIVLGATDRQDTEQTWFRLYQGSGKTWLLTPRTREAHGWVWSFRPYWGFWGQIISSKQRDV